MTDTARRQQATDILGFDPFDPAFSADPYAHYRRLRETSPVHRTPGGLWVLTRQRDCAAVLRDPRFGHGDGPFVREINAGEERVRSFLVLDPPDHTRLRGLVSKAFTARTVQRLRPRVEQLVDELFDRALGNGTVELIEALAYPLPVMVISELLGVPHRDREQFRAWSDALARGLDPEFMLPAAELARRERARLEFREYFRELAAERRRQPSDDLLSALVGVEDQGDVLTEPDLLATCTLLLIAGHETTVNLIANGALALIRHPDQLAYLREHPDRVAAAIEELLRYDPPVQFTTRIALEDAEVGGQPVTRGEPVMVLLGAANRDPDAFPDPDRLDLARTPGRQLAFGLGIHFCLGAPLARLEGEVALAGLIGRSRQLTLATDELQYKENLVLRGLASLPVRLR